MRPLRTPSTPDPRVPQAQAGLMYESIRSPGPTYRSRRSGHAHMKGCGSTRKATCTESRKPPRTPRAGPGGYIFRFVPDRRGDLTSGQLYALKITTPGTDRTGEAIWIPLDRDAVQVDADAVATAAGATGYGRPEDVEMATSTGNNRGGSNVLYVAVTDEHRVSG